MVAKLVLFLLIAAVFVAAVTFASFWYFNQEAEREHEKDKMRMKQTDAVLESTEDDYDVEYDTES